MKRCRLTFALGLFMVLFAGRVAAFSPSIMQVVSSTSRINRDKPAFPFYLDTQALLSSPGLVNNPGHAPEGSGFFSFLGNSAQQRNINIPLKTSSVAYFALLYRSLILFPFHSFW